MRIAVVGLGSVGRRHLENLLALGERDLVLVHTGRGTLGDLPAHNLPVVTRLEEAIAAAPAAAVIANPTSLHLETARAFAAAGAAIFLEKPIADGYAGVEDLAQLVRERGLISQVGFQFRFHPAFQRAKQLLDSGAIGALLSLHAHWGEYLPGWHPWEDYRIGYAARRDLGGGALKTLCHPLDYLSWFAGGIEAGSVLHCPLHPLGIAVDEGADVLLRFAGGVTGSVHVDFWQRPKRHDFQMTGTTGTLSWSEASNRLTIAMADGAQDEDFDGFQRNDMFREELVHFIDCVRRGVDTILPIGRALDVQRLISDVPA